MEQEVTFKYHAFISYRHADNKNEGRHWASWLHQALETYEIPKDLVGKVNGRGDVIPERIFPIFRDEDELPADADLGGAITRALGDTNFLIVLCSPRAVESTYVADEIDCFKRLDRSDRIMAAIIDGEPNASWDKGKQRLGYKKSDECFPVPLQFNYVNGKPTDKHAEPIAADFRIVEDGKSKEGWTNPAYYQQWLKNNTQLKNVARDKKTDAFEKQLKLMSLKVVAGIIGVSLGELTQRDKEYQLKIEREKAKKLRQGLIIIGVLALIACGSGIFAWFKQVEAVKQKTVAERQKNIAIEQRNEALTIQSNFLLDLARQKNEQGFHHTALLLGLNSMSGLYGGDRPMPKDLSPIYHALSKFYSNKMLDAPASIVKYSSDGGMFFTISRGNIKVYSKEGTLIREQHFKDDISGASFTSDGKYIIFSSENSAILWSIESNKIVFNFEHGSEIKDVTSSPDGTLIVTVSNDSNVNLWSRESGQLISQLPHETASFARFSNDGETLVTSSKWFDSIKFKDDFGTKVWSVKERSLITKLKHSDKRSSAESVKFSSDNTMMLVSTVFCVELFTTDNWQLVRQKCVEQDEEAPGELLIKGIAFSPDDNSYLFYYSNKVEIWKITDDVRVSKFSSASAIAFVTYSPNGGFLLTGSGKHVTMRDSYRYNRYHTFSHYNEVHSAAFSPDSSSFVTGGADYFVEKSTNKSAEIQRSGKSVLWHLNNPNNLKIFDHKSSNIFLEIAEKTNNGQLVTASRYGIFVWSNDGFMFQLETEKQLIKPKISHDGKWIFTATENAYQLWSLEDGKEISTLHKLPKDKLVGTAFSSNSTIFTSITYHYQLEVPYRLNMWTAKSGEYLGYRQLNLNEPESVKFSDDGKFFATSKGKYITIWSSEAAKIIKRISHDSNIHEPSFSSDNKYLIASDKQGNAILWLLSSGKYYKSIKTGLTKKQKFQFNSTNEYIYSQKKYEFKAWGISNGKVWSENEEPSALSAWGQLKTYGWGERDSTTVISPNGELLAYTLGSEEEVIFIKSIETQQTLQVINTGKGKFNKGTIRNFSFSQDGKVLVAILTNGTVLTQKIIYPKQLQNEIIDNLPKRIRCLSPFERAEYYLPLLSDEQLIERGCPQYRRENLNEWDKKYLDSLTEK